MTLVLTTHYMDEAEQLCDRLVVMDGGRIVAEGSPRELIGRYSTPEVVELRFPVGVDAAGKLDGVGERVDALPDRLLVYARDGDAAVAEVHRRGLEPSSVLVRRSTLEDVFLQFDRPDAGGVMAHAAVAVLERHLTLYRRLFWASAFSSFLLPVLFLVSIGLGVGGACRGSGRGVVSAVDRAGGDGLDGVPDGAG